MKKKVGIITMHKVYNVGSALQAYATQKSINDLGYDCELIDYEYPSIEHRAAQGVIRESKDYTIKDSIRLLAQKIKAKIISPKECLFNKFYKEYFKCSAHVYKTRRSILENVPFYDIYVTGSDQVWNPRFIGFDTNFFLDFAPKQCKKISYASSFSSSDIPPHFNKLYSEKLKEYDMISVREASARNIAINMTGKDVRIVCDPTLLINKEQWSKLADKSTSKINTPYLLVYVMGYAYNPYPDIYNYIERVNNELNPPVIYLNTQKGRLKSKYKEIEVSNWGPIEFMYLIKNAKFVITDSFHGTAFSLNFCTPFISCVKSKDASDSRMLDLLKTVNAENRAVVYNTNDEIAFSPLEAVIEESIEKFRADSISYLKESLEV